MNRKLFGILLIFAAILVITVLLKPADTNPGTNVENDSTEAAQPMNKPLNTRLLEDKEFMIDGKAILNLKYAEVLKLWGQPKEIKQVIVKLPATEEDYLIYILSYDGLDIEMYPVGKEVAIEDTESFRFDITSSVYDFYGVKVGMTLEDYLSTVQNKDVFPVKEILADTSGEKFPYEYRKLLVMAKEANYYADYDQAVYEQVVIAGMPYGTVMLFKEDRLARIVYGFPNAS